MFSYRLTSQKQSDSSKSQREQIFERQMLTFRGNAGRRVRLKGSNKFGTIVDIVTEFSEVVMWNGNSPQFIYVDFGDGKLSACAAKQIKVIK